MCIVFSYLFSSFKHFHEQGIISQSSFLFFWCFPADLLHPLLETPCVFPEEYRGFFNRSCHTFFFF